MEENIGAEAMLSGSDDNDTTDEEAAPMGREGAANGGEGEGEEADTVGQMFVIASVGKVDLECHHEGGPYPTGNASLLSHWHSSLSSLRFPSFAVVLGCGSASRCDVHHLSSRSRKS